MSRMIVKRNVYQAIKVKFKVSFQKVGCYGLPFILAVKFPSGDLQVQCIHIKMKFSLKMNCFRYRRNTSVIGRFKYQYSQLCI